MTRFLLLLPLVYLLFFHALGRRDLWSSHEARAAMDAQTILDDGDWGLPRLYDGRPELQKPPLYYWLVALLGWSRGGVDELAVRLPSTIAAVGCLIILWQLSRPNARLLAVGILATAVHFTWLARIGRIDMPLTFAVTSALASFYWARQGQMLGSSRAKVFCHLLTAYLAIAVAVMLKGPIGLVLPAFVVAMHRMFEVELPTPWKIKEWFTLFHDLGLWWGLPLVLALTLPWFIWVNQRTDGQFMEVFFWYHNFHRGLGGSTLQTHPWWIYIVYFSGDFLPWTPFLALTGLLCWRRGYWPLDAEGRFGLVWFASIFVLLSCACFKRADYLLPAYPGAALFLSSIAERWMSEAGVRVRRCTAVVFTSLCIGAVVFWTFRVERSLPAQEHFRDYRAFAAVIRADSPQPTPIILFRTEAHALAFRLGRPVVILVEWQELDDVLAVPGPHPVVAPPEVVAEWARRNPAIATKTVVRNDEHHHHERPLIYLKIDGPHPSGPAAHAANSHSDADRE